MGGIPYLKDGLLNLFKKPVTKAYPEEPVEAPEGYRGKIVFHPELCIGCGLCMRICSPASITKSMVNVEGGQEITMSFNMASCTFCSMCRDFCPKKAIEFTREYNLVVEDKNELMISGTFIKKLPPKPPAPQKKNEEKKQN
ncbi:4Fe-4S binding protein [Clostridium polynesiense]|uniref:4Fe-4S binding protein n=1 Tax=Clostridium polynesiense TaxID=1325933 RepID=UPI000694313F|nr:4Fe-4S binding protein [Clostridium polynesiense]